MKRAFMKFDSSYFLSSRYAKIIIFSLVTIFALLILLEITSLFTFKRTFQVPLTLVTPPELATPVNKYELGFTLFGKYVPTDLSEIKESKLNIEIVGILFAKDPKHSQVLIKTADGEEEAFMVGNNLPGNTVIKSIMANGILVEHNGTLESLSFPKNELSFEPAPKPLMKD
jgi:general secretion pathway protein C